MSSDKMLIVSKGQKGSLSSLLTNAPGQLLGQETILASVTPPGARVYSVMVLDLEHRLLMPDDSLEYMDVLARAVEG